MKTRTIIPLLKSLLLLMIISLGIFSGEAQTKAEKIESLISKYHEYDQFNGSALVAENGKIVYSGAHGMANFEHNVPNKPDTKFRLASITKQFTAALVLQLVEQGKLELDKPISTYLPDYTGPAADKVTIHHLLTHSSGIPSYTSFPDFFSERSRDPYTPEEFVKVFQDSALQFNPGERFSYNNSGYFLLGRIIEEVSGKSYEEMMQENIFKPLGMTNSGFDSHKSILKNRASGYEREGMNLINAPYLDMSTPYAAGSLYSTVEDMYLWDQALYGNELLSEESKRLMFSPQIPAGDSSYGYGWGIGYAPLGKSGDSVKIFAHSGGINGFNTLVTRFPESRNFVILLNNTGGVNLDKMTMAVNNVLHGLDYEAPKRSLARAVFPVFSEEGAQQGMEKVAQLKADPTYELNENELNGMGYALLGNGKKKEAIEVFKLNVKEFPESWNVYDSLGEAYMEDGQKDLAIMNYKKSIEMNPDNSNGKEILARLQSHK